MRSERKKGAKKKHCVIVPVQTVKPPATFSNLSSAATSYQTMHCIANTTQFNTEAGKGARLMVCVGMHVECVGAHYALPKTAGSACTVSAGHCLPFGSATAVLTNAGAQYA